MTMTMKTFATYSLAAALLSGCTSMNIFKDDNSTPAEPAVANLESPPEAARVSAGVSASEISKALSGKSWKWSTPRLSGVTLYANDGSSLVEVAGKGTTTGKWLAKDGELCEKMAPADFLPNGTEMVCNPVTKNSSGYKVGLANFSLAN